MFNPINLFRKRMAEHLKLLNRYLRYIFNGHFMIALIFIIITLAVYYQKWLASLREDFPASIVIAFILGILVSYNPIQTFLKEPDKVFLLVKEEQMYRYFRLTLVYNFIVQMYLIVVIVAIISPLYMQFYPGREKTEYLLMIVIILILKGWNLVTNWNMLKIRNRKIRMFDILLRTFLSVGLFHALMEGEFFVVMCALIFTVVVNDYLLSRRQTGLAWNQLIENDQHRLAIFYRFVSMFAEVPHVTERLKKRRILSSLINKWVVFRHDHSFGYLYRLTFIRSGDYIRMFVRLIVVGAALIIFIPNIWLKVLFAILFIYITSFQMVTLYHHHRTNIWLDLYPLQIEKRKNAFLQFVVQLTFIQTIIFAAVFIIWLDFASFFFTLAAGSLFNYLFHYGYVKKKILGL